MFEKGVSEWLEQYELNADQKLLALFMQAAAAALDREFMTATLSELRRTYSILRKELEPDNAEYDPLADLLKR
jgi:hypothetical protein